MRRVLSVSMLDFNKNQDRIPPLRGLFLGMHTRWLCHLCIESRGRSTMYAFPGRAGRAWERDSEYNFNPLSRCV